jgi:hypothetical protein
MPGLTPWLAQTENTGNKAQRGDARGRASGSWGEGDNLLQAMAGLARQPSRDPGTAVWYEARNPHRPEPFPEFGCRHG